MRNYFFIITVLLVYVLGANAQPGGDFYIVQDGTFCSFVRNGDRADVLQFYKNDKGREVVRVLAPDVKIKYWVHDGACKVFFETAFEYDAALAQNYKVVLKSPASAAHTAGVEAALPFLEEGDAE